MISVMISPTRGTTTNTNHQIIDRLTKDKGDALFRDWIEDMKKRISIEVYDDVLVKSIDEEKYIQPEDQPDTTATDVG